MGQPRRSTAPALPGLVEVPSLSHGAPGPGGSRDNLIVEGDNLAALAALAPRLAGQVRCIYLDPPYNTGASAEHYEDDLEHARWLAMMRPRVEALRPLLHPEGLIFVQIDDREMAYLQVLMDEVFGRRCRVNTVVVKMSEVSGLKMAHVGRRLPKLKEYLLVYGARPEVALRPLVVAKEGGRLEGYLRYYQKLIVDPTAPVERWEIVPLRDHLRAQGIEPTPDALRALQLREARRVVYRTNNRLLAGLSFPTATARVTSPRGEEYVWWEGKQMLFLSDHLEEYLGDLWTDLSTINLNKEGGVPFRRGKKPEALLARVLALCTAPGDLVLDAFAGSGTTGAVAHKLGRRWVLIEQGAHGRTHVAARLRAVVDGRDPGGITAACGWQGGGGFRYLRVAT